MMEIIIERDEMVSVSKRSKTLHAFCSVSGKEVWMMSPETISLLYQFSARQIYSLIENGKIHFVETSCGLPLVCSTQSEAIGNFLMCFEHRL